MPTWPASLPQYVQPEQYEELPAMPVAEVPMDGGAPKTFGTGTDDARVFRVTVPLDGDQVQILDTFYRTDLRDGETEFDWVLPEEQTPQRFAFATKIGYQHLGGDQNQATMLLETRDTAKRFGFRSRSSSASAFETKMGGRFSFRSRSGSISDFNVG